MEYDLTVAEQAWSPDGGIKPVPALTLNGGIPGPTLRFREGDSARILGVSPATLTRETDEAVELLRAALPRVDLQTGWTR